MRTSKMTADQGTNSEDIQDDDQDDDDHHFEDENGTDDESSRRESIRLSSLFGNKSHGGDSEILEQEREDAMLVQNFWTGYDEILILSIFTQVGILCRLLAAYWLKKFSNVFHKDSPLFTNLPLNCLSCFIMGLLCSGESLMEIITTRFTSTALQKDLTAGAGEGEGIGTRGKESRTKLQNDDNNNNDENVTDIFRRRRNRHCNRTQINRIDDRTELREVQLLAWERRIRASICLLLFPVKKEDIDIVENYFSGGCTEQTSFKCTENKNAERLKFHEEDGVRCRDDTFRGTELQDLRLSTRSTSEEDIGSKCDNTRNYSLSLHGENTESLFRAKRHVNVNTNANADIGRNCVYGEVEGDNVVDYGENNPDNLDQIISSMTTSVSNNISRIRRVNFANGFDVGTSPQEKSEDLTLGLRDGLCGALSSFSSWLSSIVNLFRAGNVGQAVVGIFLGIQLPIVAYRFGQYVSVYVFVWRCRREKGRDEKRGYGIQLHMLDDDNSTEDFPQPTLKARRPSFDSADSCNGYSQRVTRTKGRITVHDEESEVPSIRAIFTALFLMCLVAQITSLTFFSEDRLVALSLLFSPLGVLARWRMMKLNAWRPSFPIGTFACNITACALSGTLGTLIAGNPGPKERIVLVSIVAGFGGTLSSVARFIVETLSLLDPILFRLDGFYYALVSIVVGLLVSFIFSATVDWADSVE